MVDNKYQSNGVFFTINYAEQPSAFPVHPMQKRMQIAKWRQWYVTLWCALTDAHRFAKELIK